jgi:glycosyltransferase 2 family protein
MNLASTNTRRVLHGATWVIATGLLVVLVRSVDVGRLWALGQEVRPGWVALAVASNLLILPLWAQQWRTLLPPSSPVAAKRMLSLVAQFSFLGNALPASGQVSAVVLLAREPGVTSASALSALALEQVTEGIVKVGVLLFAAQLLPLPGWMRSALAGLAAVVAALTLSVVIAAFHHARITAMSARAKASPVASRLLGLAGRWSRDLESLRTPSRFALALACSAGTKAAEALAIVSVQHAFGLVLPVSTTMLVLGATILGTIAPLAPANLGIYEGAVVAAYRHVGLPPETALALAVVEHACLLAATAAVGYVVFSVSRIAGARAA